jgi:type II secretory pathway component GspD/PulD (secretin)
MKKTRFASWMVPFAFVVQSAVQSNEGRADSFMSKCPDIASCAKFVSELLGQQYVYDNDVKGMINATANTEITRENAELLWTLLLNANGYARVPLGQPHSYQIVRQRDARDLNLPVIKGGPQMREADIPANWDLFTLIYKTQFADNVEDLARLLRSFMPANSRIIPNLLSGSLLITDTGMNLRKVVGLLKETDLKPTPELKKKWAERERNREAEMKRPRPPGGEGAGPGGPPPSNTGAAKTPGA